MTCPYCGTQIYQGNTCPNCGATVNNVVPNQPIQQAPVYPQPIGNPNDYTGDPRFKPLSMWEYLGYNILFAIPLVGFICMIIFAVNNDNINRRNYARSFLLAMLVVLFLWVILAVIAAVAGFSILDELDYLRMMF